MNVRNFWLFAGSQAYLADLMLGLLLFIITALTIFPFFTGDYTNIWGSIEAAYISDAIFVSNNFPNVGWYPFWYGGLPFHLSYPPLFICLVASLHAVSSLSIAHSYRILSGIGYSAAPVALYLLAKSLTKRKLPSFLSGLIYSSVPTFLPLPYSLGPSHVGVLTVYGEGPHLFGFTLMLLALWQLLNCMNKPTKLRCLSTSALIASVALTNPIALYALALLVIVAFVTEIIYRNDQGLRPFAVAGLTGYGLVAFQYDLEFMLASAQGSTETTGLRYSLILLLAMLIAIVLVRRFSSRYLSRWPNTKASLFVALWLILFGTIIITYVWFNLPSLAPQPYRYVPEFDAGVSLLIGLVIMKVDKTVLGLRGMGSERIRRVRRAWILGALLILLFVNVILLLPISLSETLPSNSLVNVPEYQIASWLSTHVTDQSVFATGTAAFWLNVFSNVRQIRGGSDQGATNSWWDDVNYQIATGPDPAISILWAQAWNVKYVIVTFPNASTLYHDYTHPNKFANVLPLRYYFKGFGIYEVPLARPGLVEDISTQGALSLSPITGVLDTQDLSAYVKLAQNPTNSTGVRVTYTMINPDLLQVSVSGALPDTAILVKMTYDLRWHAELDGKPVGIQQLGPDFMVTYPQTKGNYQLTFHFGRSEGETIGLYLTMATIAIVIIDSVLSYRRKRRSSISEGVQPVGSEKHHDEALNSSSVS